MIHRDLKPHNVIVGDSDHAKVTDFGIARAGASDMTETGSIMGTAQYLSPEQAQGHAVGETSRPLLDRASSSTRCSPAGSRSTASRRSRSRSSTSPRRRRRRARSTRAIPPELEQVVLWALNKNPADRPQDADQFINVLEQVREEIAAGPRGEETASMAAS